ncbi:YdcF family protein [Patescibacteria group bacterium]
MKFKTARQKKFVNIAKYLILILAGWFFVHSTIIIIDGLNDNINQADTIVIFGNKVETNGLPSARLQSRLVKGIELYDQNYAPIIIVSGGFGKEGFDEATVMKDYLSDNGVPEENIIVDSDGNNTYQTAKNVKRIMETQNMTSVIIVTQYYHVARARLAFKKFGIENVYSAHALMPPELRDPYSIFREFVGYYAYLFKNYDDTTGT